MTMFGRETLQYGRPLRSRQDAWIYRRSTRLVPLLLRARTKTGRAGAPLAPLSDNDNAAGQDTPDRTERRGWEPALASR